MNKTTIWVVTGIAGILAIALVSKLFQPSGLEIAYDAQSYFEVRRLFFAAGVLAVLAFILVLSIAVYASSGTPAGGSGAGKEIFDSMIKVVPPIITLVLGYYFGQQSVVRGVETATAPAGQIAPDPASGAASSGTLVVKKPDAAGSAITSKAQGEAPAALASSPHTAPASAPKN